MSTLQKNGTKHIQMLIDTGVANGTNEARVFGDWEIESEIRIPSNFTLYLDGCHLVMADGVYSNMFVNKNHGTDIGRTIDGTDKNIKIIGLNNPILDGGNYNGLSEKTHSKNGLPHIMKNITIFFSNVENFEITGISIHNNRYWGMCFTYSRFGKIHNVRFKSSTLCRFEDGTTFNYLRLDRYDYIVVRQADGIDLRQGCHDIDIYDIYGITCDDSIALTNLKNCSVAKYGTVEGLSSDIYNVNIKHIRTSSLSSNVRLLCTDGQQVYNILVEDLYDTSWQEHGVSFGLYAVKLQDGHHLYGQRHGDKHDMRNITLRNIRSRACFAFHLGGYGVENLVLDDVEGFDGAGYVHDMRVNKGEPY